jgi:predicted nuclease of predicted toxin-antitoxin system
MRFLADESRDAIVVHALRSADHDVVSVAEAARGAKDTVVLGLAREQGRVPLTEDKDFGSLVYAAGHGTLGVILFRFPARARGLLEAAAVQAVGRLADRLGSSFTVVSPGRVRVSRAPSPSQ